MSSDRFASTTRLAPSDVGKHKGRSGERLVLKIQHVGGRCHLPVVELKTAA